MSVFVRAAQRQKKLLRVSVKFISYIFSQRINDLFTTPQVCCIVLLEENLLGRFIKRSVFRSHILFIKRLLKAKHRCLSLLNTNHADKKAELL